MRKNFKNDFKLNLNISNFINDVHRGKTSFF